MCIHVNIWKIEIAYMIFISPPKKNALYGCMYVSWADRSFNYKKGYASVDVYKMIFCIYGHYRFQIYFALWFEIFTSSPLNSSVHELTML